MIIKKFGKIFLIILIPAIIFFLIYLKFFKKVETVQIVPKITDQSTYNSNIIENVNYTTVDNDGNEYKINALKGEIDYSNSNILFLTNVNAIIKLKNSENITISSDYGKYNSENFDTIFSKNVIINYLKNKITGEYLDFSLERNSMIVSKNVVYTNLKNILKADAIEMNIKTKDTKIFMYENQKKVNIKSKN
jgi:LPS export ABC transporter protein LptC